MAATKSVAVVVLAGALAGCGGGSGPGAPSAPASATPAPSSSVALPHLLVGSRGSGQVMRFDGTGRAAGAFSDPGLVRPVGVTFGPDGDVYVAAGDTDRVVRFSAAGAGRGTFTSGGGFVSPRNVNFGPDGAFYVADGFQNRILRFDGGSGLFDRAFVDDSALQGPTSFTFGPDGDVYAVSVLTNQVLRFDGATGALRGPFATTALALPHDVSFGPDGHLYVTNSGSGLVQRFRGDTGAHLGAFVSDPALRQPLGMAWGPDGHLYVANQGGNEVRRYDGATGAGLGAFVAAGAGGLSQPSFLAFEPSSTLVATIVPDVSRPTSLVVTGARPGARVLVVQGTTSGASAIAECPSAALALSAPTLIAARTADESGNVVLSLAAFHGATVLAAVDASRCAATNALPVTLP
jgi:sugar lactone lactonase YvrE